MNWLTKTVNSSVGKKQFMAVTGLGFCCFLAIHLFGNMFVYLGKDAFNSYVDHLHALGPLVTISEIGLVIFALIHICMAAILFLQNLAARPVGYVVKRNAGGRTPASATMPYTGLLILIFIIIHMVTFKFADHSHMTVYEVVETALSNMPVLVFYILSTVVVAFHVNHGLWSAFQTFGANHPKYMPIIRGFGIVYSLIIGIGFGFVPVFIVLL